MINGQAFISATFFRVQRYKLFSTPPNFTISKWIIGNLILLSLTAKNPGAPFDYDFCV